MNNNPYPRLQEAEWKVDKLENESARQNIRIKELQRVVEVLVAAVHEMNQGDV